MQPQPEKPSRLMLFPDAVRLDFMLLRKDQFKVPAAGILADGPPTQYSDHLALWAEFEF